MKQHLLATLLGVLLATPASAYDLEQHRWQHRLLFLFAPSNEDPALRAQLQTIAQRRDAVLDRDLRVFALYPDSGRRDGEPLGSGDVRRLRGHFAVDDGESVLVLVGLDGGEKRRAPLDTDLRELFLQIDAMPMRQADIRAKQAAGVPVTDP